MDGFLLLKLIFIGFFSAGGFYVLVAYAFHYVPLPAYLKLRARYMAWAGKRTLVNEKAGLRWEKLGKFFFGGLAFLTWCAIFVVFSYVLYAELQAYLTDHQEQFWAYYGATISLPALLFLWRSVRFFIRKKPAVVPPNPLDELPLWDQITAQESRTPIQVASSDQVQDK